MVRGPAGGKWSVGLDAAGAAPRLPSPGSKARIAAPGRLRPDRYAWVQSRMILPLRAVAASSKAASKSP